eukprot:16610-Heterococcus_DN1.PRE.7
MADSGRMSMSGVNESNVVYLAKAMHAKLCTVRSTHSAFSVIIVSVNGNTQSHNINSTKAANGFQRHVHPIAQHAITLQQYIDAAQQRARHAQVRQIHKHSCTDAVHLICVKPCSTTNNIVPSSKRTAVGAAAPLEDAGTLLNILSILGPGQHLFISAVSRAWRESYSRVGTVQMPGITEEYDDIADLRTIGSLTTLYSAVFASAASVRLAHECGLNFDNKKLHRIAGRAANLCALQAACELGLQLTDDVLIGAAAAASVSKLQWLHVEMGCRLPPSVCYHAARSGSIDSLRWLIQHVSALNAETCAGAAAGAHIHVLQYLRDEGCEWDECTCSTAAWHGHLPTLQWLHEQGCPWDPNEICGDAAYSGSIKMLVYLREQGCQYVEDTMMSAAMKGQLAVCQYLVAEQCLCDTRACGEAASGGHMEIVRFLHESGCPWDVDTIGVRAAESDNVELLRYLRQQGCVFTADAMTAAAALGHLQTCKFLRAEQCPWDAIACRYAALNSHVETLRWLHEQGCPWDVQAVRLVAAKSGDMPTITYALDVEPAASAAQLTDMLNAAGSGYYRKLAAAKWLRQQGAEWPAVLKYGAIPWSTHVLQWARDEGCTSPTDQAKQ